MTTERMQNALALADQCWEKAYKAAPEFVERYLELSEELLSQKLLVTGDEFREFCAKRGLRRPPALHHNVWVSGVRALNKGLGWIEAAGKVEPVKAHNHMPSVTIWRSKLYGEYTGSQSQSPTQEAAQ